MRLAIAAAFLGLGVLLAHAGHDNVKVDSALKRYGGVVTALGEADAEGRIYSFRAQPMGPAATTRKAYVAGELRGWRLTFLAGQRFAQAFEVDANTESEITVRPAQGPLNGIAVRDVFVIEEIALAK